MAPMVKEPETLSAALKNTVATPVGTKPQPAAAEIAVIVNGVRTVEGSEKREPFSENTNTVLVFATGAVIRLTSAVAAGQLLFLTNEKTKKEVVCQVVKARNERSAGVYVELEFTQASPGFWGMRFPGNGSASPSSESNEPISAMPPFSSLKSPLEALNTVAKPSFSVPASEPAKSAEVSSDAALSSSPKREEPASTAPTLSAQAPANGSKIPSLSEFLTQGEAGAGLKTLGGKASSPSAETKPETAVSRNIADENQVAPELKSLAKSGNEKEKTASLTELLTPAPKAVSAAPGTSTFDFAADEVKIPSWLEPLARNATVSAPAETVISDTERKVHEAEFAAAKMAESKLLESKSREGNSLKNTIEAPENSAPASLAKASSQHAEAESTEKSEAVLMLSSSGPSPNFGSSLTFDRKVSDDAIVAKKSRVGLVFGLVAPCLFIAIAGVWYWNSSQSKAASSSGSTLAAEVTSREVPSTTAAIVPPVYAKNNASESAAVKRDYDAVRGEKPNPVTAGGAEKLSASSHDSGKQLSAETTSPSNIASGAAAELAAMEAVKKPSLGNVHLAAPVVNHRGPSGDTSIAESDLALNSSTANSGSGANLLTSKSNQPAAPLPIGGNVVPAKLLSAIAPTYPQMAKIQHISGDVKIDAFIAADGHVSGTKVISGPALLHQAAVDAVRQWKYQAASLNGQAMPMHLTVTVQFKLK